MLAAARQGDLQGRLIKAGRQRRRARRCSSRSASSSGPIHRGKFAYLTASLPAVREVLSSNDFRVGFEPAQLGGPVGRLFGWAADTGVLGPLEPPSLLVTEPAGPHPLPQARHPRVHRPRGREAARAHRARSPTGLLDELEAAADAGRRGRSRRALLHAAAGHGDRRDPRRAGQRARARAGVRRRGRAESGPRPDLAAVPQHRGRAGRLRRLAGRAPGAAARQSGRRPAQPARRRRGRRRRPGRARAQGHRGPGAGRRLRDDGEPARQRRRAAVPSTATSWTRCAPSRTCGPTRWTRSCASTRRCC